MSGERKKTVLISVADKAGLGDIGRRFSALNWHVLSSGGTGKALVAEGTPVTTTAEFSGQCMANKLMHDSGFFAFMSGATGLMTNPAFKGGLYSTMARGLEVGAMFDHRLATISSPLYGGLLSDPTNKTHMAELASVGWEDIDIVICDFYPLGKTLATPGFTLADVIKNWDVGGPAMIMAAAKSNRLPICRVQDRDRVLKYLEAGGEVPTEVQEELRQTAVFEVGRYYMELAVYLGNGRFDAMIGEKARQLAYGENKYQSPATLFRAYDSPLAWHNFNVLTGDPSYISIADGDRALGVMCAMTEAFRINCQRIPAICIACKHGNPCGIGISFDWPGVAILKALFGDPIAVMGAELMVNFPIDGEMGRIIYEVQEAERCEVGRRYWSVDVLYAPSVDSAIVELLGNKERRRILVNPALSNPESTRMWMRREVQGGWIRQKDYHYVLDLKDLVMATEDFTRHVNNMIIAWAATWRSVSNTVAIANDDMLQALGAGQQDRMACVKLCVLIAAHAPNTTCVVRRPHLTHFSHMPRGRT